MLVERPFPWVQTELVLNLGSVTFLCVILGKQLIFLNLNFLDYKEKNNTSSLSENEIRKYMYVKSPYLFLVDGK